MIRVPLFDLKFPGRTRGKWCRNFKSAALDRRQAHQQIVDDAVLVWVVHDTNPHALSPKVKKIRAGAALVSGFDDDRAGVI
jgi:hypothetical protein